MKLDHMAILKRAWRILWKYKALWVFGIILALTTARGGQGNSGSGASFSGGSNNNAGITPPPEIQRNLGEIGETFKQRFEHTFTGSVLPQRLSGQAIFVGIVLICLAVITAVVLLIVVTVIARYIAENALIKMVDDHETTGTQRSVKEGLRMGWSRAAFRQCLINLVVTLPLVAGFVVALLFAGLPLLCWLTDNVVLSVFGTVGTIGLFFLLIFVTIIVATIAVILVNLAWRATSLNDLGVFPSLQQGWALIREDLKEIAVMWLLMFGIRLGYTILLIPVVLVLLIFAGASGGLVFLTTGGLASLFLSKNIGWIIAGIIGIVVFIIPFVIPLTLIEGLFQVYKSTVWTLTYRELTLTEALAAEPAPPEAASESSSAAEPESHPPTDPSPDQ